MTPESSQLDYTPTTYKVITLFGASYAMNDNMAVTRGGSSKFLSIDETGANRPDITSQLRSQDGQLQ